MLAEQIKDKTSKKFKDCELYLLSFPFPEAFITDYYPLPFLISHAIYLSFIISDLQSNSSEIYLF